MLIACDIVLLTPVSLLFSRMNRQLLILTWAAYFVQSKCLKSDQKPEVTVGNASHLFVSWKNAFQACEKEKVKSASVRISRREESVNFSDGNALVKASPCLTHSIREAIPLNWLSSGIYPLKMENMFCADSSLDNRS